MSDDLRSKGVQNQVTGAAKEAEGKIRDAAADITGDESENLKAKAKTAEGDTQEAAAKKKSAKKPPAKKAPAKKPPPKKAAPAKKKPAAKEKPEKAPVQLEIDTAVTAEPEAPVRESLSAIEDAEILAETPVDAGAEDDEEGDDRADRAAAAKVQPFLQRAREDVEKHREEHAAEEEQKNHRAAGDEV